MNMTKQLVLFVAAIGLCSPLSFADDHKGKKGAKKEMSEEMKKEMFEVTKKESLSNLDQRIQHLQETKSCVSSASDGKALKKCRMDARKKGESLRAQMKEKRKEMKDKHRERMQARKKQ